MRVVAAAFIALVSAAGAGTARAACLDARDPLMATYRYPTLLEEVDESHAIVIGTVVKTDAIAAPEDPEGIDDYVYTIEVKETLKGSLPEHFKVHVGNGTGSYRMTDGETHLLFIDKLWGELGIDPCGNSKELKDAGATLVRLRSGPIADQPMSAEDAERRERSESTWGPVTIHGRLRYFNGNPSARIWIVGTRYMLGVREADEGVNIPKELSDVMSFDRDVYADFDVAPLTPFRPGSMRIVRIVSARNIVVTEGDKVILMKDKL